MESVELSEDISLRTQFTVDNLDIEILPLIYEIIRRYIFLMILFIFMFSIEKDPHDTSQKAKESQDTSHKILELQKKLDSARSQIKRLPGIEYSKEEQLQKLETLRKQLRLKRELLLKYRNTCTFEIPKV
ncbi:mediator of RNA polymerase II transcription subunit 9 isoform X1 [Mycetomoellerius zeteki]|uniref:mediator of RNA polymerase II transcription subunit 9 isoform X1 n=1 Tax=Mycetomoellerius zeteki TaxID=64791 RepID=UPI00084E53C9|nr:PREDICTED: mediator of RNA polymerase II transcription subunit 9 isoform X1 [Trachymyrmex zeteki]